jgi:hypothetical protein
MRQASLASISVLLACAASGCATEADNPAEGSGGAVATGGISGASGGKTGSGGQVGNGGSTGTATGTGGSAGVTSTGGSAGTTSPATDAASGDTGAASVCRPRPPCAPGWFHYQDTVCPYPSTSGPGCSSRGDGLCYQECKTSSDCTDPHSPTCSGLTIFGGSDVGQTKYVCTSSIDMPACPATASGGASGGGGSGSGGASGAGGIQAAGGRPGSGGVAGGGGAAIDGATPVDGDPATTNLDGAVACSTYSESLACKTDSDCCLVYDQCYSHLALVAKADVASVTACYATKDTFWCTSCSPPAVDAWCENGQCLAAAVPGGSWGTPHCGRLSTDAGTTSMSAKVAREAQPAITPDAAVVTGTWFGCGS